MLLLVFILTVTGPGPAAAHSGCICVAAEVIREIDALHLRMRALGGGVGCGVCVWGYMPGTRGVKVEPCAAPDFGPFMLLVAS
jgi:hypothetical protein